MKLFRIAALTLAVLGFASVASASTIWNFNNVLFNRQGPPGPGGFGTSTITGWFQLAGTGVGNATAILTWDFTVGGTNVDATHHYLSGSSDGATFFVGATHIDFYNFSVSPNVYLQLYFQTPLTNAGGSVSLANPSIACPGCGTLVSGNMTTDSVGGFAAAVPEPTTLALVAVGGLFLTSRLRRRQRSA